ncbi:class I SAM-dependent methyltransferase [Streptomyces sp. cg36]|uniref:class I SAM-dependent methyltransferase n=1 Tax=Streptomyces sp. cg36 TaxID=3238798 RepID=UPI0034E19D6B
MDTTPASTQTTAVRETSDWTTAARARECGRPDAYLRDYYAATACGPAASGLDRMVANGGEFGCPIARGRLGDALALRAVAGGVRQVVCLGAGGDTRAWRLRLPSDLAWWEVDLPGQLDAKNNRLAALGVTPHCPVTNVTTDLRGSWTEELAHHGHNASRPTLWIADGLFYFLTPAEGTKLIDALTRRSAPGSRFCGDIPRPAPDDLRRARLIAFMDGLGCPFVGGVEHPHQLFTDPAWRVDAHLSTDLAAGRCPLVPSLPHRLAEREHHIWYTHALLP